MHVSIRCLVCTQPAVLRCSTARPAPPCFSEIDPRKVGSESAACPAKRRERGELCRHALPPEARLIPAHLPNACDCRPSCHVNVTAACAALMSPANERGNGSAQKWCRQCLHDETDAVLLGQQGGARASHCPAANLIRDGCAGTGRRLRCLCWSGAGCGGLPLLGCSAFE